MKRYSFMKKLEKGQVIPLVVLMLFAIIGMIALILDGGGLMSNRRTAQAAADAGALAGAQQLCLGKPVSVAEEVAESVALENNITSAVATASGKIMNVVTEKNQQSWFARIFNQTELNTGAEAEAGCFSPKGNYLMPIAWSCRPPIGGGTYEAELGCKMQTLDWDTELGPLVENKVSSINIDGTEYWRGGDNNDSLVNNGTPPLPPSQIYIVMDKLPIKNDPKNDSDYIELICKEDICAKYATQAECEADPLYITALTCDLNGDGRMDIEGGGNRGWLDLNNGGGGTSDLRSWIKNPINFPLSIHTWLSGEPGTTTPVYEDIEQYRQGEVVLIPVFNQICQDKNPTTNIACMSAAHANPWEPVPASGDIDEAGAKPKFHIVSFDAFYISCVHTSKQDDCPGFKWAQSLNNSNKGKDIIKDNTPSVEGFFIEGYEFPLDFTNQCSLNLGNCSTSLTR